MFQTFRPLLLTLLVTACDMQVSVSTRSAAGTEQASSQISAKSGDSAVTVDGSGDRNDPFTLKIAEGSENVTVVFAFAKGSASNMSCTKLLSWMSIEKSSLKLQPGYDAAGDYELSCKVSGKDDKAQKFFVAIEVTESNRSPSLSYDESTGVGSWSGSGTKASPYSFTVSEGSSNGTIKLTADDPDGDSTSLSCANKPDWLSVTTATMSLTMTPGYSAAASNIAFSCKASDQGSSSENVYFSATVINVDASPSWSEAAVDQDAFAGQAFSYNAPSASDADGDTVTYSFDLANMSCDEASWSSALTIHTSTGALSGTPTGAAAVVQCTVKRVATSNGQSIDQTLNIRIYPNLPGALTCDTGDRFGLCVVSTTKTLAANDYIAIPGDLQIANGGRINGPDVQVIELYVGGDVTIDDGGQINANLSNLTAQNLTLASGTLNGGARINASLKGHAGGTTTGSGTGTNGSGTGGGEGGKQAHAGGAGAGHARFGGMTDGPYTTGNHTARSLGIYGSPTAPDAYGSGGGGADASTGGRGGGRLKITLTETLTNNGSILADAGAGGAASGGMNAGAGGGSGGSIWISANELAGTGAISANGGNGGNVFNDGDAGGGGSGGRISLTSSGRVFLGTVTATGGSAGGSTTVNGNRSNGGDGTVHWSVANPCDTGTPTTTCTIRKPFYLADNASLSIAGNLVLDTGATIACFDKAGRFNLSVTGSLTMQGGGRMVGNASITAASVSIAATSSINASFTGFQTGGTGAGTSSSITQSGAGGGYGGAGGNGQNGPTGGSTYGSNIAPVSLGSAGGTNGCTAKDGGFGGGAVKIQASGAVQIDGNVLADGHVGMVGGINTNCWGTGGGSGGSIWIVAANVSGSGNLSADGGEGGPQYSTENDGGGAGGGGRISIDWTSANTFPSGNISYAGGIAPSGGSNGSIGTLCINQAGSDC